MEKKLDSIPNVVRDRTVNTGRLIHNHLAIQKMCNRDDYKTFIHLQ